MCLSNSHLLFSATVRQKPGLPDPKSSLDNFAHQQIKNGWWMMSNLALAPRVSSQTVQVHLPVLSALRVHATTRQKLD